MGAGFEAVIGLEVHAQLSTRSKIFCPCPSGPEPGKSVADLAPNANSCPVCAGHPGTLPVLNRQVVEYAIRAGLATGCRINPRNIFARKNYFYPDLPKGYQLSQYDAPICEEGGLEIETKAGARRIRIQRIHMEEDAGKNTHHAGYSLINLNRAGTPLIEIVTAPDLRSSEEAGAYLRALHAVVTYLGVCDGNMQEGNFRCDANVSVKPEGASELGTRVEIKNVNSFRFVEKAIEHEIARQVELIRSGGRVVQETRTYDSDRDLTVSMRSKEEAHDYRYFPDPDLVPVQIDDAWIARVRSELPELPHQKRARFVGELGLSAYDAGVLVATRALADFYDETVRLLVGDKGKASKLAANFLIGEITRRLNDESLELAATRISPAHLARVVALSLDNTLSSTGAKQVINAVLKTGEDVDHVIDREGLRQVNDLSAFEPAVAQVIAANPGQAAEFRAGKDKLLGFFVGQVMKATGGKANPAMLQELVRKKLQEKD